MMQSFLEPLEPKEESAEVKVFSLNHISCVQVEMLEVRNHFLMISNIQRHLQVCSHILQSRAGKGREVTLWTLSRSEAQTNTEVILNCWLDERKELKDRH